VGTIKDTDQDTDREGITQQEETDQGAVADAAAGPLEGGEQGFAAATMDELRKVVWPSRQQLFSESVAVILMVSASAAAIAAIDRFYSWTATQVFR
jgi:preprotein translocase subunit SecE